MAIDWSMRPNPVGEVGVQPHVFGTFGLQCNLRHLLNRLDRVFAGGGLG